MKQTKKKYLTTEVRRNKRVESPESANPSTVKITTTKHSNRFKTALFPDHLRKQFLQSINYAGRGRVLVLLCGVINKIITDHISFDYLDIVYENFNEVEFTRFRLVLLIMREIHENNYF